MSDAVAQILSRIPELSHEERAELAYAFAVSLEPDDDPTAGEEWDAEVARRMDEITSGSAVGKPAEQVFAEMRAK